MTTPANSGTGQEPAAGSTGQAQEAAPAGTTAPAQSGQSGGQEPQQTGQQQGTEPTGTPDLSAITDPNLRAWVEHQAKQASEARQEAARYRTERNTLREQAEQAQRANETAEQTAERERAEQAAENERIRQENRDLKSGAVLSAAVTEAKAINPETFAALLKSKVTIKDDGSVEGVEQAITDLRKSDPYLFRRTDAAAGDGGGAQGNPAPGSTINDFIRGRVQASR